MKEGHNGEIFNLMTDNSTEYEITANITTVHDSNYGADADGNRGIAITELDEVIITSVINKHSGIELPLKRIPWKTMEKLIEFVEDKASDYLL